MRRLQLALAVVVLSLLAGCGIGSANTAPTTNSVQYNDTDIMFVQMMVKHYAPAAEMLRMARDKATSNEIRTLAAAVAVTQDDERKTMLGWLSEWQQPETSDAHPDAHAAHGGLPGTGEAELEALTKATGAEFDKTFLNLFTAHQHQAVELARMEVGSGHNKATMQLAERIDKSRRGQIELMLKLMA
ncbi:MAG TPA: DUF305 domain-containing protein [Micromonosporaceae bacterium]|nr:DUF305 domain-containing protein [Micromonosporaceae bacterium]HCU49306.1 DUF305 domain-containing protein [Micromonosporaceae bacterium]